MSNDKLLNSVKLALGLIKILGALALFFKLFNKLTKIFLKIFYCYSWLDKKIENRK